MSAVEMQSLLARLYMDEYCRHLFHCKPELVLEKYRLTKAEVGALVSIEREALDYYANGLLKQRQGRMRRRFPYLYAINDATDSRDVEYLFGRFHSLHPATAEAEPDVEVRLFSVFIEQSLAGVEDFPPYAGDMARYDAVRFCALRNASLQRSQTTSARPEEVNLSDVYATPPHTYVETFAYNVVALARHLRDHRLPTEVEKQATTMVFQNRDRKLKTFTVSGPTAVLLQTFDGLRTVAEAVEAVEAAFGIPDLSNSIIEIIRRLKESDVIRCING